MFLIHVRPYLQLSRADLQRRLDRGAVLRLPVVILSLEFLEIVIISLSRENKASRKQKKSSCVISLLSQQGGDEEDEVCRYGAA